MTAPPAPPLPEWLRYDPPRLLAALAVRTGDNPAAVRFWQDVVALAVACDDLARDPEREAELTPVALGAAELVADRVPPNTLRLDADDREAAATAEAADEALATLFNHVGALVAALDAPPDAPDLVPEVGQTAHELVWLLSIWRSHAEFAAHVASLLRPEDLPYDPNGAV